MRSKGVMDEREGVTLRFEIPRPIRVRVRVRVRVGVRVRVKFRVRVRAIVSVLGRYCKIRQPSNI